MSASNTTPPLPRETGEGPNIISSDTSTITSIDSSCNVNNASAGCVEVKGNPGSTSTPAAAVLTSATDPLSSLELEMSCLSIADIDKENSNAEENSRDPDPSIRVQTSSSLVSDSPVIHNVKTVTWAGDEAAHQDVSDASVDSSPHSGSGTMASESDGVAVCGSAASGVSTVVFEAADISSKSSRQEINHGGNAGEIQMVDTSRETTGDEVSSPALSPKRRSTRAQKKAAKKLRNKRHARMPEGAPCMSSGSP